jgi:hypothetical protein
MSVSVPPDVPMPAITDRADGHSATCPVCSMEIDIAVTNVPYLDSNGVQWGFTTDYDLTAYITHYQSTHETPPPGP